MLLVMATEVEAAVDHPLDPLTPAEIDDARSILESERDVDDAIRYVKIVLDEPSKAERREESVERRAFVILRDPVEKTTYEVVVSLDESTVVSWENVEGVQPSITLEEFDACEEAVKANEEWREAVAKRGVENFDLAIVDPWSAGHQLVPEGIDTDRRLAHGMT